MQQYKDELELKQALGINNWRELSRDKMLNFAAIVPHLDSELAMRVVEQFPSFKEFATDVVDAMENAHDSTLTLNDRSTARVHDAFRDIRTILKQELDKGDLTWQQRRWLVEQIQETGRQQFSKDSENKRFLDSALGRVVVGAGGIAAIGLAAFSGRVIERRG